MAPEKTDQSRGCMRLLLAFLVVCVALQSATLPSGVVDAQYSPATGKIILVSSDKNLYICDPASAACDAVALSQAPLALSVSPDGTHAAVLQNDLVTYVDLSGETVSETVPTAVASGSIALSASGIYAFPDSQGGPAYMVFAWGPSFGTTNLAQAGSARFDAALNAVVGIRNDFYPGRLFEIDVSYGYPSSITQGPDTGACGNHNLWLSPDGSTIYTACGAVFNASGMTSAGNLAGLDAIQSLSASSSEIAAIPARSSGPDTEVWLYDSSDLSLTKRIVLPGGGHGKWVFLDGTKIFVIAQEGSSYVLDTIDPTNVCTAASFSSSTSVSVAASGALEDASISSNTGCTFHATSNASWISLVSGNYGTGDTTLRYVVRPNTTSDLRTGTISLNSGATLAITQSGRSEPSPDLVNLSVNPVAADYSKSLDKLVYVSAEPNEIHLYDPATQSDTFVPLAYAPTSLSVGPTGLYAAVGHDGRISYVDLDSMALVQVFPIDADVTSLALDGGYIYFSSDSDPLRIFTLSVSDGTVTSSLNIAGAISRLVVSSDTLYLSGNELAKWDLTQTPPVVSTSSAPTCGNLWASEDGSHIYTACANAYRAGDFSPDGLLSEAGTVQWAAGSTNLLAVIPLHPPGTNGELIDSQIQIYSDPALSFIRQAELPSFSIGGTNYTGHGKYAFWDRSASDLIVVEQADSSAPLLSNYGVYTTSTCSYSLSPGSLPVAATAGSGIISVTASNGCTWSAESLASWIQISAGGSGTGSGTLAFTVQPNSGPNPRTGTITVEGQSATISQAVMPLAQLSASGLNFGSVQTGTPSTSQTVTVTNTSSAALSFGGITISGSTASDFQIKGKTCGATLAAGTSCSVTVAFLPQSSGIRSATLTFSDNAYAAPQSVSLTGTAVLPPGPTAQVAPASIDFGTEQTGIIRFPRTVTITNTSPLQLSFRSIGISGADPSDFVIEGNTCGSALPVGSSCTVTVAFRPTFAGYRTASLTFVDTSQDSAQSVALTGTAIRYLRVSGGSVAPVPRSGDFDGDGLSDFVVWRPSEGTWYVKTSSGVGLPGGYVVTRWGLPDDVPVTGDFDGDGKTDYVVWRPSDGSWYVLFNGENRYAVQRWGLPDDIPVSGDFDGDGKTDFAVWRPSDGSWYVLFNGENRYIVQQWGLPGDIPVPGDYDGDGKTDFAVWRPSNASWYILPSSQPGHYWVIQWGFPTDIPLVGDFDGDGKDDLVVWRPSNGTWFVKTSSGVGLPGGYLVKQWGLPYDLPQVGDFDTPGKANFTVFRPEGANWFLADPNNGWHSVQWGLPGDIPQ